METTGIHPYDPTVTLFPYEVLLSALAPEIVMLANHHVQGFAAGTFDKEHDWNDVMFAPVARYIYDPAHEKNGTPAYVEIRVTSAGTPHVPRGYILVSLTEEDYPVPEFATRGKPKTEQLLARTRVGMVQKILRFGAGYLAAEDAQGDRVASLGTTPRLAGIIHLGGRVAALDSELSATEALLSPIATARPLGTRTRVVRYSELKADFAESPARVQGRALRSKWVAAAWKLAKGIRNPILGLHVGETQDFLIGMQLARVSEAAAWPEERVRLAVLPGGGFRATGVTAGSVLVRVVGQGGDVDLHTISVAPSRGASDVTVRDFQIEFDGWIAGTDWDGDQRQYDQLTDHNLWCPLVGCGPTALAMMLGWWDVNGVPSALYRLVSGQGNPHEFRFEFESLRDADAPKDTNDDTSNTKFLAPLCNDLYLLGHTYCFPWTDQGATNPDQLISAFQEYVARIANPQPPPMNEFGDQFVRATKVEFGHVTAPGFGETDWENGGKKVAHGIQRGVPGIVGIGSWAGDLHYPLAYGYGAIRVEIDGQWVEGANTYFKCNMGWGPNNQQPQFHVAEDVWFGLTATLEQIATPTPIGSVTGSTTATDLQCTIRILMENLDIHTNLWVVIRSGEEEIARQIVMHGEKPEFFVGSAGITFNRTVDLSSEQLTFEMINPGIPSNPQPHVRLQVPELAFAMDDGSVRAASITLQDSPIFTDKHHENYPPGHWNFVDSHRSTGRVPIHIP